MKRALIRSNIFNLLFFITTGLMCVALLPTLILPRKAFMWVVDSFVHMVHFLEKNILGLNYEIRGAEHLPKDGSYIIAAKHQSPYETFKLHILFNDPAVILKQELLKIPLWGAYLKKSAPIAIDRSNKETATASIKDGALRVKNEGRPIIIFPQGTRVHPETTTKEKPYKFGITRIQEATDLPIIPMALNAGCFWPRSGWLKSSGTVIFEFLPPIKPGKKRETIMSTLEKNLETKSDELAKEAKNNQKSKSSNSENWMIAPALLLIPVAALVAYSYIWFMVANEVNERYQSFIAAQGLAENNPPAIKTSGFPFELKASLDHFIFENNKDKITFKNIQAKSWPLPNQPIQITSDSVELQNFRWKAPLTFDFFDTLLKIDNTTGTLEKATLTKSDFTMDLSGTMQIENQTLRDLDMNLALLNHETFLKDLGALGILDQRMGLFLNTGLQSLAEEDGRVNIPIYAREGLVHAGPFPIMPMPRGPLLSQNQLENEDADRLPSPVSRAAPGSRSPLVPTPSRPGE